MSWANDFIESLNVYYSLGQMLFIIITIGIDLEEIYRITYAMLFLSTKKIVQFYSNRSEELKTMRKKMTN